MPSAGVPTAFITHSSIIPDTNALSFASDYNALGFTQAEINSTDLADTSGTWQLRWILTQADTDMYPGLANFDAAGTLDNFRLPELAASLFDPAISVASPAVDTGSVAPGTDPLLPDADFRLEFDLDTAPTTGFWRYYFRYQDANNYWYLELRGSDASTRLYDVVDGTPLYRAVASGVLANNQRITMEARGATITAWHDTTQDWSYASANDFLRERDWSVQPVSSDAGVSNLDIWKAYARNEVGLGAELVTNGDFSAWTADDPDGWTVTESGDAVVTENPTGECQMIENTGAANIKQAVLTVGKYYRVRLTITAVTGGLVSIGTPSLLVAQEGTPGDYSYYFLADNINIQIGSSDDVTIDNVSVKQVQFSPDALGSEFNLGVS